MDGLGRTEEIDEIEIFSLILYFWMRVAIKKRRKRARDCQQ